MSSIYNSATICPYKKQNCTKEELLTLNPHIYDRMAMSRNYDELLDLWKKWHDASGKLMRTQYAVYVEKMNQMAKGNNFTNAAEYWQSLFEIDEFEKTVDDLWLEVKPLYNELHKYMRFKLISIYGEFKIGLSLNFKPTIIYSLLLINNDYSN